MDRHAIIGQNIKKNRKKLNITQIKLAEELGYTQQTVSNWERGENYPSPEDIEKMSVLFGIAASELRGEQARGKLGTKYFELIEVEEIPYKEYTFVLFFKHTHYKGQVKEFSAWIYDEDYPTMFMVSSTCAVHSDYISYKKEILDNIELHVKTARDFMDEKQISEEATTYRTVKEWIEKTESFADSPQYTKNEHAQNT